MTENQLQKIRSDFEAILPPLVARVDIAKYTGGLYTSKTMQTFDYRGIGPQDPVFINNKVAYLKENLINWIMEKLENKNA